MAVRIKVNLAEYRAAESNGAVYGKYVNQRPILLVYAELGIEREYISSANDDSNTNYRMFTNCAVFFYRNQADLDADRSIREQPATVIIFT